MNEDIFNLELRKFLKKVGVTSQREIEAAVRSVYKRDYMLLGFDDWSAEAAP